VLLPLACAIPAFVLSMLCLFAGSKKGYMEDYHIIMLNTSSLGHLLVNNTRSSSTSSSSLSATATATSSSSSSGGIFGGHHTSTSTASSATSTSTGGFLDDIGNDIDGIGGDISGVFDNLTSSLQNELIAIEDDLADDLAQALGIDQWYSMHLMDMCYGYYKPNATAAGASLNISNCTAPVAMYHFDPAETINTQLLTGPFSINISDIGWNSTMEDGVTAINTLVNATFVLYTLGIAFSGLSIITTAITFFLAYSHRVTVSNWTISFLAASALTIASALVTVVTGKVADAFNQYGDEIGVYAYKGTKFLGLTWAASALMIVATTSWFADCYRATRDRKRAVREKGGNGGGRSSRWGRQKQRSKDVELQDQASM